MQNLKLLSGVLLDNYKVATDMKKKKCTRVLLDLASPLHGSPLLELEPRQIEEEDEQDAGPPATARRALV
jgi:hypothetical protein